MSMNLKKRIISIATAVALAVTAIPTVAFAGAGTQGSAASSHIDVPFTGGGFSMSSSLDPLIRVFAIPSFIRDGSEENNAEIMLDHLAGISAGHGAYYVSDLPGLTNERPVTQFLDYRAHTPAAAAKSVWVLPTTDTFNADKIIWTATSTKFRCATGWTNEANDNLVTKSELGTSLFDKWMKSVKALPSGWGLSGAVDIKTGEQLNTWYANNLKNKTDEEIWDGLIENGFFKYLDSSNADIQAMKDELCAYRDAGVGVTLGVELYVPINYNGKVNYASMSAIQSYVSYSTSGDWYAYANTIGRAKYASATYSDINKNAVSYYGMFGNIYRMHGTCTTTSGTFAYSLGYAAPRIFLGMLPAYSQSAVNSQDTAYDAQTFYKFSSDTQGTAPNSKWTEKDFPVPEVTKYNFPGGGGWSFFSVCHDTKGSITLVLKKEFEEAISTTGKVDESTLRSQLHFTPDDKIIQMNKAGAPTAQEFLQNLVDTTGIATDTENSYASIITRLMSSKSWITSDSSYFKSIKAAGYPVAGDGSGAHFTWDTQPLGEGDSQNIAYTSLAKDKCNYIMVAEKKNAVALPDLADPTLSMMSGYGNMIVYRITPDASGENYTVDSCKLSDIVTNGKSDIKKEASITYKEQEKTSGKGVDLITTFTNYYSVTEEEIPVKALFPEVTVMDTHKFTTTYTGEIAKLFNPTATTYTELVYTNTNRVDERINGDDTTKELSYDSLKDWLLDDTLTATYAEAITGADVIKLNAPEDDVDYTRTGTVAYINLLAGSNASSFKADKRFLRTFSGNAGYTPSEGSSVLAWNSSSSYTDTNSIDILGDEGDCEVTLTPNATYTIDFGNKASKQPNVAASEGNSSDVQAVLDSYSEYVKNYTAYESLVANYNQRFKNALGYYKAWVEYLLSEVEDIKSNYTAMTTPTQTSFDYVIECYWCKNGVSSPLGCSCSYNSDSGYYKTDITDINTSNKAIATTAASALKPLAEAFYKITGIKLEYYCGYAKYTGSKVNTHNSNYYDSYNTSYGAEKGPGTGVSISPTSDKDKLHLKFTYPTKTTTNYVAYSSVPSDIQDVIKTALTTDSLLKKDGTAEASRVTTSNSQALAGYIGNVLIDFSEGMAEQVKLENNRPNAEIHFTSTYNYDFDPDEYFGTAVVPEYMAAKYWKNPLEFMKPGKSLLQAILDYDGRTGVNTGTSKSGILNNTVRATYASDKAPTGNSVTYAYGSYMDTKTTGAAFAYAGLRPARGNAADSLAYSVSLAGKSSKQLYMYKEMLQFMKNAKTNANTTADALNLLKTPLSNANNTTAFKTTYGKYSVVFDIANTKAIGDFYKGAFDALGYITESMSVWTSRWKLTTGDADRLPTKQYGISDEWAAEYNLTSAVANYDTLVLEAELTTADSSNLTVASADAKVRGTDYAKLNASTIQEDNVRLRFYRHLQLGVDLTDSTSYTAGSVSDELNTTDANLAKEYASGDPVSFNKRLYYSTTTGALRPAWYSRSTPYKLSTEFNYYVAKDMPGYDVPDSTPPDETILEEFREELSDDTAEHLSMTGGYARAVDYSVYPVVKYAYDAPNGSVDYTYIAGQKARKFTGQTYFAVGILSPNGTPTPTVIADAVVADSNAAVSYGGKQSAYSGSGVMVAYDEMDTNIVMQTYTLVDRDVNSAYQSTWNSDAVKNFKDGHKEFLEYIGCTETTTSLGTPIMALPYVAGCEVKVTPKLTHDDAKAKTWNMTTGTAMAIERSPEDTGSLSVDGKQYINLKVAYGELVGVYTDSAQGDIVALTNSVNTITIPAGSSWTGTTTAGTFAALQADGKGLIVRILRSMGINEDTDVEDLFRSTFEHSAGLTASSVGSRYINGLTNGVAHIDGWYNEYCDCIALEFDSTAFAMEPLVFSDKIPVELGPSYDPSRPFSQGYAFNAQNLMIKMGAAGTVPGSVQAVIDQVWKMQKHNPDEADLIIADVPVTAAH